MKVNKIKVVDGAEQVAILNHRRLWRLPVPGGWICWAATGGAKSLFYLPDAGHRWQPEELESGAPFRIEDENGTTVEQERAILERLEEEIETGTDGKYTNVVARVVREITEEVEVA